MSISGPIPLCIDLDGTLIRSDLLIESALALLRHNPLYIFYFCFWLWGGGKAKLKQEIAKRSNIDVTALPYDARVLAWVREQALQRPCVLCTASDQLFADKVAKHLGVFSRVFASDGKRNLSGRVKGEVLRDCYGDKGFDYAGNAATDLLVWAHARYAIIVNASTGLAATVERTCHVERVFPREGNRWREWVHALRVHQWLKNILLFLPLLTAHRILELDALSHATWAFICFSLCASSVYVLNDLLDLHADRCHPRKKLRPFAAGTLSLQSGLILAPLLTLLAFALASLLSLNFLLALGGYYLLTLAYSLFLKRIVMLDVVVLAGLYTVRILAGAIAIPIPVSFWLLAFSMFLFLSLAILKRYTEIITLKKSGQTQVSGRGYMVSDAPLIQSLGSVSGYLSVLVLALYINSTASEVLYRHVQMLWLLCPLLLYWISRAWLLAYRGNMHDDPVLFAVMDNISRVVLFLSALVIFAAL